MTLADVPADPPRLPPRAADSHKGDYGKVLIIGGSRGMSGAVTLAGLGALRAGSGLVRLAVPNGILPIVAGYEPSYMTVALPEGQDGGIDANLDIDLTPHIQWADVVACGPGLGRSSSLDRLVTQLYAECSKPLILDADALNALAEHPDTLDQAAGMRILTPHLGEFARLLGRMPVNRDDARQAARELARNARLVIVLKGHGTFVTDGDREFTNTTGNPGMATGGVGDVLTGLLAGILGQCPNAFDASCFSAYIHGLAGDIAAAEVGPVGMIASDIARFLPRAIQEAERTARD
jgi:ADP-dependent NAD(P)H-hydrate dehydratase